MDEKHAGVRQTLSTREGAEHSRLCCCLRLEFCPGQAVLTFLTAEMGRIPRDRGARSPSSAFRTGEVEAQECECPGARRESAKCIF